MQTPQGVGLPVTPQPRRPSTASNRTSNLPQTVVDQRRTAHSSQVPQVPEMPGPPPREMPAGQVIRRSSTTAPIPLSRSASGSSHTTRIHPGSQRPLQQSATQTQTREMFDESAMSAAVELPANGARQHSLHRSPSTKSLRGSPSNRSLRGSPSNRSLRDRGSSSSLRNQNIAAQHF